MNRIFKKRSKFCVRTYGNLYKFNTIEEVKDFLGIKAVEVEDDFDQQPIPFYDDYEPNFSEEG